MGNWHFGLEEVEYRVEYSVPRRIPMYELRCPNCGWTSTLTGEAEAAAVAGAAKLNATHHAALCPRCQWVMRVPVAAPVAAAPGLLAPPEVPLLLETERPPLELSAPAAKPRAVKRSSTTRQPAAKKTVAKKPAVKEPTAKKPVAKKPAAEKPVAKKPVAKKSLAVKKSAVKKPARKKAYYHEVKAILSRVRTGTRIELAKEVFGRA
jgi:hypothetical protein